LALLALGLLTSPRALPAQPDPGVPTFEDVGIALISTEGLTVDEPREMAGSSWFSVRRSSRNTNAWVRC